MESKNLLITGATSGFGQIVALRAAELGYSVWFLSRSKEKGDALLKQWETQLSSGPGSMQYILGDLDSFSSTVQACKELASKNIPIHCLMHNAGVMNFNPAKSKDNIEQTWQINLLAPMLMTHLLYDQLADSENVKIVFTASALHQGTIQFDDLEFNKKYSTLGTYRQSKLGVILMARYLTQMIADDSKHFYSIHPGVIRTDLGRDANWLLRSIFWLMGKSIEHGAKTHLHVLQSTTDQLSDGAYYADEKEAKTTETAHDMQLAEKLHSSIQSYLSDYLKMSSPIFPKVTVG